MFGTSASKTNEKCPRKLLLNRKGHVMRPISKVVLSTFLPILAAILLAPPAAAQAVCGPHRSISESLNKSFTETPVSMGVTTGGGIVEVYASPEGTWTLVVTQPNGMSCLIAAGQNWESLSQPKMVTGARI